MLLTLLLVNSCVKLARSTSLADNSSLRTDQEPEDDSRGQKNQGNKQETGRAKRRIKLAPNLVPEFSAPIGNVTAVLGRDVRLVCQVENLGQYQVSSLSFIRSLFLCSIAFHIELQIHLSASRESAVGIRASSGSQDSHLSSSRAPQAPN